MNARYRCFRRASGVFYLEDTTTHQQSSLKTRDKHEAARLTHARNEAHLQPQLNRRIAQAYLAAGDPQALTRTWQDVMEAAGDFARRQIKPRIRLGGHWLARAGFTPGQRVAVRLGKPGELTLLLQEAAPAPAPAERDPR